LYTEPCDIPAADLYFAGHNVAMAIACLVQKPRLQFPAWLIVAANDSLMDEVAPRVRTHGYRCFKLKLLGRDNAVDVARTVEVFRAVRAMGVGAPRLTVDSNEANPDAVSVLDYLERLKATDPGTFEALEYLEQPTSRDIVRHRHDWRAVARVKPVLLDEGLISLELLPEAVAQGWSGLALKTCKGHSFALVAAAWAREHGLLIALQDLTNPGLAAIHAALFAARIPTLNGAEINSPQYTPAANKEWLPRYGGLFEPTDGVHRLETALVAGLGSGE
jgi:L-alanine-DL-glutamate epimerase-like enolase superfamily enzyme